MKLNIFLGAVLFSLFILSGCKNKPEQSLSGVNPDQASGDSTLEGEKTVFYENGSVHYIVEYKNGKANGRVREYTPDGKIYMDAIYRDGHRNGKCIHYFKNGVPFGIANFVNGEKDGNETKYYNDGKVLATLVYKKNKIQPGLKEYRKDGTEIKDDTELIVKEVDHTARERKYFFQVSLSKPQKFVEYYVSPQTDPDNREKLKLSGDAGIMEIPVASRHFVMKDLIFQAEYKTQLGNTMRLQKLYRHSVK